MILRRGSNHRSDIYSYGVTAMHVISSSIPDRHSSTSSKVEVSLISMSQEIKIALRPLLISCLSETPISRPSAREVRNHIYTILLDLAGDPRQNSAHASWAQIETLKSRYRDQQISSLTPPSSPSFLTEMMNRFRRRFG